jgi:hypothetical protein
MPSTETPAEIDWLDLTDTERLETWAALAQGVYDPAPMPDMVSYQPYSPRGMQEKLAALWKDKPWPEAETIQDIVVAAFFKNDPYPPDYERDLMGGNGRSAAAVTAPPLDEPKSIPSHLVYEF